MQSRMIVGAGTPEHDWQAWSGLHRVPCITLSQLIPPSARTVIISPHPDDEILATGGLLAMLACEGAAMCVVAVTNGGASHPDSSRWSARVLAKQRSSESLEGLARLGVPPHSRHPLDLPDGQVASHRQAAIDWLRDFLRPDDVAISPWVLDGHPDHEASAQATALACGRQGILHIQVPIWMWHWACPADTRVPWQQMIRLPLSSEALMRKRHALDAHRTQLEPQDTGRPAVLASATTARLMRQFEFFILPA